MGIHELLSRTCIREICTPTSESGIYIVRPVRPDDYLFAIIHITDGDADLYTSEYCTTFKI